LNKTYATKYLDLVALGMDADMMSLLSIETKHLINKGLSQIKNPFFEVMVEKAAFKMKEPTPIGVAFYVAPFVNAAVRSGTQEEKEIIFQSMLNFRACAKVPSTKRGHKPGEMEAIYVQAARTATNVKNRQTRAQDAGLEFLENQIEAQNLLNNKVLLFKLKVRDIDRNIAGLVANKFMAKYQRPCCILTRVEETQDDNVIVSYQGSARGCDKTGIDNFKEICEATNCIMYAEGHQGAFGLGIDADKVDEFLQATDEALKDMSSEPSYYVDYILTPKDDMKDIILTIADMQHFWGKDFDEALICVKGIKVKKDMLSVMKSNTLKIVLPNGVSIIKFGATDEEIESLSSEGYVEIDVVCRCNANEWNGNISPQLMLEAYEIVDACLWDF
jgi:single-stranded-DNA-specific exonuclease